MTHAFVLLHVVELCTGMWPLMSNLLYVASFPGSHAREREHWSCAGVESLVFFVTWKAEKIERRY